MANISYIRIRAVQGRGLADTFSTVEVPDEGDLVKTLKCGTAQQLTKDAEYADVPCAYTIITPGTEPNMEDTSGEPSLEYVACWTQNRKEWVGLIVKRTKIYEGVWQGIDQMVECEGPFKLTEDWGRKILEAYNPKKQLDPKEVLHTEPTQLL